MKIDAIGLRDQDNVATSLRDLHAGEKALVGILDSTRQIALREDIPYGHKFAIRDITEGDANCSVNQPRNGSLQHQWQTLPDNATLRRFLRGAQPSSKGNEAMLREPLRLQTRSLVFHPAKGVATNIARCFLLSSMLSGGLKLPVQSQTPFSISCQYPQTIFPLDMAPPYSLAKRGEGRVMAIGV